MTATCRYSTSAIRVYQHGGNVKRGPHGTPAAAQDHARVQCIGRSRDGLTTKIHVLGDAYGLPVALQLTEGPAHDGRSAADMFDTIGPGHILLVDRAYDSNAARLSLNDRRAWAIVKPMPRRAKTSSFSPFLYRHRSLVERFFNKLKHDGAIATHYEKHAANYLAFVKLAASRIWLRAYE